MKQLEVALYLDYGYAWKRGNGRAIYEPHDKPVITPGFIGTKPTGLFLTKEAALNNRFRSARKLWKLAFDVRKTTIFPYTKYSMEHEPCSYPGSFHAESGWGSWQGFRCYWHHKLGRGERIKDKCIAFGDVLYIKTVELEDE
jgi:hypothetical protein